MGINSNSITNNNMKLNVILFALVCLGVLALALAHDGQDNGGDKKDWNDNDGCNDDDDEKEEGKCFWKCVKVCHKKKPHTTTTKDCPKETTTTKDCPKETTTTRKHRTTTPNEKDCRKTTSTTTK